MNRTERGYLSEDHLELYALDRLPEQDAAPVVQEHLLLCEECRVRLTEWDTYVAAMRAAMHGLLDAGG